MRPLSDLTALDPNVPADAATAIEAAEDEVREAVTSGRRAAQARADTITSRPANAIKLARRV